MNRKEIAPIKLRYPLPQEGDAGYFGTFRKYDIHTGIDLYCNYNDPVFAIEAGTIVAVEAFTGEHADSPWWNNTWAVLVEGESGVICYGELLPLTPMVPGAIINKETQLGNIIPVLKEDKGKNPVNMLHLELYTHGTRKTVWWKLGEERPSNLLNPRVLLPYEN